MYELGKIKAYKKTDEGTELKILVPSRNIGEELVRKRITNCELRIDDGRTISNEQRKKAYALINAISAHTGFLPEETKQIMKNMYFAETGQETLSLRDCSVDEARSFITLMLKYCIENGVQLQEPAINYAEDIGKYLYYCLHARVCCICGLPHSDIHHVDAIGAGRNRDKIDDSKMRKMCLCRRHHGIAHQLGRTRFEERYHVYGIIVPEIACTVEEGLYEQPDTE